MVQSTLAVYSFFQLCNGIRVHSPCCTDSLALTWHCEYDTALQCMDNSVLPVRFHIFSPPSDGAFANCSVSFVQVKAYIPSNGDPVLLEGIWQALLPGNPEDDNYQAHAPNLIYTMVHGVGVVKPMGHGSGHGDDRQFEVEVCPWVCDDNRLCTIVYIAFNWYLASYLMVTTRCAMLGHAVWWKNVPLPFPNTIIYFMGVCTRVQDNGMLEVALDDLVFNLTDLSTSPSPMIGQRDGRPPTK